MCHFETQHAITKWRAGSGIWSGVDMRSGGQRYFCGLCGRSSSISPYNIQVHVRLHTGERPFVCPVCGRSYVDKRPMLSHIRKAHGHLQPFAPVKSEAASPSSSELFLH
ncbi:unnamed protein product [Notodromas monacha]|uniref:C2H2-type domain-containing protein n=1 Tax=Notodromas monacha TaxID=399045 RepID=A0A7R9BPC8_9CRUS|nr:unnamed protein product [Notodromas monacha]CAG0918933.1 unnamed protein product [Notodromas monacha]